MATRKKKSSIQLSTTSTRADDLISVFLVSREQQFSLALSQAQMNFETKNEQYLKELDLFQKQDTELAKEISRLEKERRDVELKQIGSIERADRFNASQINGARRTAANISAANNRTEAQMAFYGPKGSSSSTRASYSILDDNTEGAIRSIFPNQPVPSEGLSQLNSSLNGSEFTGKSQAEKDAARAYMFEGYFDASRQGDPGLSSSYAANPGLVQEQYLNSLEISAEEKASIRRGMAAKTKSTGGGSGEVPNIPGGGYRPEMVSAMDYSGQLAGLDAEIAKKKAEREALRLPEKPDYDIITEARDTYWDKFGPIGYIPNYKKKEAYESVGEGYAKGGRDIAVDRLFQKHIRNKMDEAQREHNVLLAKEKYLMGELDRAKAAGDTAAVDSIEERLLTLDSEMVGSESIRRKLSSPEYKAEVAKLFSDDLLREEYMDYLFEQAGLERSKPEAEPRLVTGPSVRDWLQDRRETVLAQDRKERIADWDARQDAKQEVRVTREARKGLRAGMDSPEDEKQLSNLWDSYLDLVVAYGEDSKEARQAKVAIDRQEERMADRRAPPHGFREEVTEGERELARSRLSIEDASRPGAPGGVRDARRANRAEPTDPVETKSRIAPTPYDKFVGTQMVMFRKGHDLLSDPNKLSAALKTPVGVVAKEIFEKQKSATGNITMPSLVKAVEETYADEPKLRVEANSVLYALYLEMERNKSSIPETEEDGIDKPRIESK